ncbi:hypothetical protein SAMN04488128_103232 [Chitinophaga eiseniae]|uniref:Uncharacterized protein n=1 Tax=Chitinophaga eiseniae TaxID=634771 RepID=A0A1T4SPG1_9BACT|nr:hypothetical protein [Chitinophaga eiseniae]SKA30174.1 hypothetical protein SAMN04488128_103232 [Chitinophaga eiseniae]
MTKKFWFFIHNAIAHPLLCIDNRIDSWPSRFHDWTGEKMGMPH